MQRICVFVCWMAYSSLVFAGCGEEEAHCYHYQNKKLLEKSLCNIQECANSDGGLQRWDFPRDNMVSIDIQGELFHVNGKPGFALAKGKLRCYGVKQRKSEMFCRD